MRSRQLLTDHRVGVATLGVTIVGVVVAVLIGMAQLRSGDETPKAIGEAVTKSLGTMAGPAAGPPPRAGWGPSGATRPVIDWNKQEDRKGFLDGPHFNSITNTPSYGQEMSFLDARRSTDTQPGAYQNEWANTSGRYVVRAYIENGANDSLDPSRGNARGTRVRVEIPSGVANGFDIQARVAASNAIPSEVYDIVTLRNEHQTFDLEFVRGSARIFNNAHPEGLRLDDEIVDDGVFIGYDEMDGVMPPGYRYAAIITLEVEAVPT